MNKYFLIHFLDVVFMSCWSKTKNRQNIHVLNMSCVCWVSAVGKCWFIVLGMSLLKDIPDAFNLFPDKISSL